MSIFAIPAVLPELRLSIFSTTVLASEDGSHILVTSASPEILLVKEECRLVVRSTECRERKSKGLT